MVMIPDVWKEGRGRGEEGKGGEDGGERRGGLERSGEEGLQMRDWGH